MPRQKPTDKLEALKAQQAQIANQIRDLEARSKAEERKADTRRKVIAGALALEHIEKLPQAAFAQTLNSLINEYVKRPADRALFGLSPDHLAPAVSADTAPPVPAFAATSEV
jgi:uncharacterized protein involved in exopolysaccharide biosynthesis